MDAFKQGGRAGAPTGRKAAGGTREGEGLCWGAEVLTPLSCCRCWCCFWPGASHCREVKRMQHGNLSSAPTAGSHPLGGYSSTCIPSPLVLSTQLEAPGTKIFGDWLALVKPYGKKG